MNELEQLRAELEAARKVADAAVAWDILNSALVKTQAIYDTPSQAFTLLSVSRNNALVVLRKAVREYRARVESQGKEGGTNG